MISVLIETHDDDEALAKTLASLVTGALEGVVKEVIVCDRGSTDGTAIVAEQAGCVLLSGVEPSEAVKSARGDWLLFVRPGARLASGWVEPVREHIAVSDRPAKFTRSRQTRRPFLLAFLQRRDRLADGLLMRKGDAGRGRAVRLRAEIHAV